MSTNEQDARTWQMRAATWELLAFSLRYPDEALADAVLSGEWDGAIDEIADAWGIEGVDSERAADSTMPCASAPASACTSTPASASVSASEDDEAHSVPSAVDAAAFLHILRAEATRLFIGAPKPEVSPYEGVLRAEADDVQALLFVNPHSMAVERFCHACGLASPEGANDPLDHVATECELLEYLAALESGIAALPDTLDEADLPEGSVAAAYRAFVVEHAAVWMPSFAEKVLAKTENPVYRKAARLLAAFATLEAR